MANTAQIKAVITAEDKASSVLSTFSAKTVATGQLIADGIERAGQALYSLAKSTLSAYAENQVQVSQLNQVLQTTGKVANLSSKQVEDLALSLEKYSGQAHTSIEQGQVLLLQFNGITKDTLPAASRAMVDLAQRMGVDSVTAAKQLGIAIDDPIVGMTRLRRSGIDFTDAQKQAIKALKDSGDAAGASALLMKDLEAKIGGAAGAYRNTFAGSMSALKNQMTDIKEVIGKTIADALTPFIAKLADVLQKIDWTKVISRTVEVLKVLFNVLRTVYTAIKDVVTVVIDIVEWFNKHRMAALALAIAFGSLALALAIGPAIAAVQVGFATLTLITIPSLIASLGAMGAAFIAALPIAAIIAGVAIIIGELTKIIDTYKKTQAIVAETKKQQDELNKSLDATDAKAKSMPLDLLYKIQQGAGYTGNQKVYKQGNTYVGGYASGTDSATPGWHPVGENGPEWMQFKGGEKVLPSGKTPSSAPNINVNFNGIFTGNESEFRKLAVKVMGAYADAKSMGTM